MEIITIEDIKQVYESIFKTLLGQYTMRGLQGVAAFVVIISWLKRYFSIDENQKEKETIAGLTLRDIANGLLYLLAIGVFDIVLRYSEGILAYVESKIPAPEFQYTAYKMFDNPHKEDMDFLDLLNPAKSIQFASYEVAKLIMTLGELIFIGIDKIMYGVFLADRYFMLTMLHLCFPLVIAMAALDKYRDMVYNFFKLLAGVYMIVPLLYIVNYFGNIAYISLVSKISAQQDLNPFMPIMMSLVMIIFVVWVKFRLFKRVFSFTFQIIR